MSTNPPPGWYPDPQGIAGAERHWNGNAWSDQSRYRERPKPTPPPPPNTPPSSPQTDPLRAGWSPPPSRTFGEAIQTAFSNYATFSGRASRSEFWWFALFYFLAMWGSGFLGVALLGNEAAPALWMLAFMAMVVPWLAVGVRRLHDTGRPGAWLLIGLIPLGGIVLLVLTATDGQPRPNQYG